MEFTKPPIILLDVAMNKQKKLEKQKRTNYEQEIHQKLVIEKLTDHVLSEIRSQEAIIRTRCQNGTFVPKKYEESKKDSKASKRRRSAQKTQSTSDHDSSSKLVESKSALKPARRTFQAKVHPKTPSKKQVICPIDRSLTSNMESLSIEPSPKKMKEE